MRSFSTYLAEQEERIDPNRVNLSQLYRELNRVLFGGQLADYPISFGKTPKGSAGVTHGSRTVTRVGRRTVSATAVDPASIRINIAPARFTWDALQGVVAHEMCHALAYQTNRIDGHGVFFQAIRSQAQKNANFTIPLADETPIEEYGHEPKPVVFIAGEKNGKPYVQLYRPVFNDPTSVHHLSEIVEKLVKQAGFKWAALGYANTILAGTMTIARKVVPGKYSLATFPHSDTLKSLNILQVYHSAGPLPTFPTNW